MEAVVHRARIERRRERRYHADIPSILVWDGMRQSVTIRNISAYGALLRGAYLPPVGTQVTLIADRIEIWATVIWSRQDQCGLILSGQIEPFEMLSGTAVRTADWTIPQTITLQRIGEGSYAI